MAVPITDVMEDVIHAYAEKISYKDVKVERRYEFNEKTQSNPGAIRQVFADIVLNALESAPFHKGQIGDPYFDMLWDPGQQNPDSFRLADHSGANRTALVRGWE